MRVIAGTAGGLPLAPPPRTTRPTMDKVRAAIFSSLGDAVLDTRVLDLFAGSGALGIEALSRGAIAATFVDADRAACAIIRRNLASTKLSGTIQTAEAARFLARDAALGPFDLIFADPPYKKTPTDHDFTPDLLADPTLPTLLARGGTFILESVSSRPLPDLTSTPWQSIRSKTYGETTVTFLIPTVAELV